MNASPIEIPGLFEAACRAHSGTSLRPAERAAADVLTYQQALGDAVARIRAAAGHCQSRGDSVATAYQAGYISHLRSWLAAKSNCLSTYIAGSSNFNSKRHSRANEREQVRLRAFTSFERAGLAGAVQRATPPEEPAAAAARLTAAAVDAQRVHELMKTTNRLIRLAKGNDCMSKLVAAGLPAALATEVLRPDEEGHRGFSAPRLSAARKKAAKAASEAAKAVARLSTIAPGYRPPAPEGFVLDDYCGEIEVNLFADRVRLFFEDVVPTPVRNRLRAHGLKWAPSAQAWQRQATPQGIKAARILVGLEAPSFPNLPAAAEPCEAICLSHAGGLSVQQYSLPLVPSAMAALASLRHFLTTAPAPSGSSWPEWSTLAYQVDEYAGAAAGYLLTSCDDGVVTVHYYADPVRDFHGEAVLKIWVGN